LFLSVSLFVNRVTSDVSRRVPPTLRDSTPRVSIFCSSSAISEQNSDTSFSKIAVFTGPHRGPRPLSSIFFLSLACESQPLINECVQPAEKSPLATVKLSKLDVLDTFDTSSTAFVGKFMDVSYFTCLDVIANAIDDLIALEDIYVSATGDSDKPTVEPVDLKPSVDEIYDINKRQVNSFGETNGYKRDSEQLVPKPVAATTTE
jgi:hypothetical protein